MDHQPPVKSNTEKLTDAQRNFEKRFSCPICLDPKLRMVVSSCQHRACSDCLYDPSGMLRDAMKKCPTCQRENAFPEVRPDIPEDAIFIQRQLGVTECPLDGCEAGLWMWDVEKHIESCPHAVFSPKPRGRPGRKRSLNKDVSTNTPPMAKQQKQAEKLPRQTQSRAASQDWMPPARLTRSNSYNAERPHQFNYTY